jgi:sec-independent protein translocase protein TatB
VLRELGRAVGKMRRMATEFQGQFMEAVRVADMADIKDEVAKLAESARVDVPFNPMADIKNEIMTAVDRPSAPAALSAPPPDLVAAEASSPKALPEGQGAASAREEAAQKPDHTADTGIDAEMQALADALKAEIGAAPELDAAHAPGRASTLRNNA